MRRKLLPKRPENGSKQDNAADDRGTDGYKDLVAAAIDARDRALAERDAALAETADLRRQVADLTEVVDTAGSAAADALVRAALSEAQTIRDDAELTATQIIELAQERASVVHRKAEAQFRERIREIANDDETPVEIDPVDSESAFDLTHVVPGGTPPPPPPSPLATAETQSPAPATKSFESLWMATASVDDDDLERFFSEEVERTEQRALFES